LPSDQIFQGGLSAPASHLIWFLTELTVGAGLL
jgi:hypothetical protein